MRVQRLDYLKEDLFQNPICNLPEALKLVLLLAFLLRCQKRVFLLNSNVVAQ